MALYINEQGKVKTITPPQNLTTKEKKDLDNIPINKELIKEAMNIKFNIVNG